MAHPTSKVPGPGLHPTDVFEEEMADLEKTTVGNWSTWLAGIGAVALLTGIVLIVLAQGARTYRAPTVIGNLPTVSLLEPKGTLDHLPSSFRWHAVGGARSYMVTVQRADSDEVVLVRTSRTTSLSPNAQDLAQFRPGEYRWSVEARGGDSKTQAWGEGEFSLAVAAE